MQITDDIIIRVLEGKATKEEFVELKAWLQDEDNRQHFEYLREIWNVIGGPMLSVKQEAKVWTDFKAYMHRSRVKQVIYKCSRYAAIVIVLFAIPLFFLWIRGDEKEVAIRQEISINPGRFQAILTVPGGESIELRPAETKCIDVSKNGKATNGEGGLVYERRTGASPAEYNQVHTPCGGEYSVMLADGTKVYMNSGSTLKFPVVFNDSTREVYLSGEAYFEVQKDSTRPFRVKTDAMVLSVYGTEFNINTFESIKTVLFSGRVGIKGNDNKEYILEPSQLIEYDKSGNFVQLREVDTRVYLAWKEGYFFFDNENLAHVLAALGRWYNVEFEYNEVDVKDMHFTGHIKKYENMNVILDAIRRIVHVRFDINGRKIEVTK
ncbi:MULTISPECIES: FecR family protein [Butyricimonas]|uniref:FecR family protein n=1 Tax=Butyricimonas TaxID=574697 RepID=UPI0007FB2E6D|nr:MULTISPECIES: FecR family protein [Butyricimonas]